MKKRSKFSRLRLRSTEDSQLIISPRSTEIPESELFTSNLSIPNSISSHFETIAEINYSDETTDKLQLQSNVSLNDELDFKEPTEKKVVNLKRLKEQKSPKKKLLRKSKQKSIQKNKLTFNPVSVDPTEIDVNAENLELAIALSKSVEEYENFEKGTFCHENNLLCSPAGLNTQKKMKNVRFTLEQYGFRSNKKIRNDSHRLKQRLPHKSKFRSRISTLYLRSPEEREDIIKTKVKILVEKCIENNSNREKKIAAHLKTKYVSRVKHLNEICHFPPDIYSLNHLSQEMLRDEMFYNKLIPTEHRVLRKAQTTAFMSHKSGVTETNKKENDESKAVFNRSISPELFSEDELEERDEKVATDAFMQSIATDVSSKALLCSEVIQTKNGICLYESFYDDAHKDNETEHVFNRKDHDQLPEDVSDCESNKSDATDNKTVCEKTVSRTQYVNLCLSPYDNAQKMENYVSLLNEEPSSGNCDDVYGEKKSENVSNEGAGNLNPSIDASEFGVELINEAGPSKALLNSDNSSSISIKYHLDAEIDLTQNSDDSNFNYKLESSSNEEKSIESTTTNSLKEGNSLEKSNSSQLSQSSDILMDDELNYSCHNTSYKTFYGRTSLENACDEEEENASENMQCEQSTDSCEKMKDSSPDKTSESKYTNANNAPSDWFNDSLEEYLCNEVENSNVTLEAKLLLKKNATLESLETNRLNDSVKRLHPRITALTTPQKCVVAHEKRKSSERNGAAVFGDVKIDNRAPPSAAVIDLNKTPENDAVLRVNCITPMENYQDMDTPKVLQELDRYGLKPLKRPNAVKILEHIYNSTHPAVESTTKRSEEDLPEASKRAAKKRKVDSENSGKTHHNDLNTDLLGEIEIVGDSLLKNEKLEDLIFERKVSSKMHSCRLPFQIAWHNFLSVHPALRENMLMYEPLQLEVLHRQFKELGFKFHIEDLLAFFDRKCITIRTNQTNRNGRNRKK